MSDCFLIARVTLDCRQFSGTSIEGSCGYLVFGFLGRPRAKSARGGTTWQPKRAWRTSISSGSWRDWDVRETQSQSLQQPNPVSRTLCWEPSQGSPGFISIISVLPMSGAKTLWNGGIKQSEVNSTPLFSYLKARSQTSRSSPKATGRPSARTRRQVNPFLYLIGLIAWHPRPWQW